MNWRMFLITLLSSAAFFSLILAMIVEWPFYFIWIAVTVITLSAAVGMMTYDGRHK